MANQPNPLERLALLEQDVKELKAQARAAELREKNLATRLTKLLQDHSKAQQKIKDLELAARKTDAKITHVAQTRKG
ncbi:hypothetical protein [Acinetobacter sp.]|uniref:hypothetical protein n=1 Tax=Acinetobacter sp. TaxID=472 RepID=UPI00388DFC3F